MEEPSNDPAGSSALEAQVATLSELLAATAEAAISLSSDLGAVAHETGDSGFDDLRVQLFDVSQRIVALALQLRKSWPEAASSSSDSTSVAD